MFHKEVIVCQAFCQRGQIGQLRHMRQVSLHVIIVNKMNDMSWALLGMHSCQVVAHVHNSTNKECIHATLLHAMLAMQRTLHL
jgi:hypothetical protein